MGILWSKRATASVLLALALSCSSKKHTSYSVGDSTCVNSLDCRGQPNARTVCDIENAQCVQCLGSNDCTDGNACYGHACRRPCASDNDCAVVQQLCNLDVGLCVSCIREADCENGMLCEQGSCTASVRTCDPSDCSRCVSCFDLCTCNGNTATQCAQTCSPDPPPGCTALGCFERCICETGAVDACVAACSTAGSGGSAGTGGSAGSGGTGGTSGGTGGTPACTPDTTTVSECGSRAPACVCGCAFCPCELKQCWDDVGCLAIYNCTQSTGCADVPDCYRPETCQAVFDAYGGLVAWSATRLQEMFTCLGRECPGGDSCLPR